MWVFCNNGNTYGDNYFKDYLWEFKCTQKEITLQLTFPALVLYSFTIPDSPVFVKQFSPGHPQHFTHGKFQLKWSKKCLLDAERVEKYLKCKLQHGRRMGFLINVRSDLLLLLSNLLVVIHLLPVPSVQLHRGNHYDSFLPSFLRILQHDMLLGFRE